MKHHMVRNVVAGSVALATISCIAAPIMLGAGIKALRRHAGNYYLDLASGRVRPKDENVIILEKGAYTADPVQEHTD